MSQPYFGWFESRHDQRLGILIHKWDFRICPSVDGDTEKEFSWTGSAAQHNKESSPIPVHGYFLDGRRSSQTKDTFRLSQINGPSIVVTMALGHAAYDQCLTVFASTLSCNSDATIQLRLQLTSPNWKNPQFWDERWQSEELVINDFSLQMAGGRNIDAKSLWDRIRQY